MINEDRKKLYDALSSEYDLGTYEEFERNIGDSVKRRKLYDAASADYDLGDFESYSQRIGPTHKESLDAFTAEHGSWLNDFEARDSAETNMSKAGMSSGVYVPAEGSITGEERKRYMELHKQEEALKKAWFTSDEYLTQKDADALFLSDARKGLSKQMMEYAQANPVLRQEGPFQINPYATRGAEADTELEKYRTASRILDDAIKMHNAPSKYDDKNVFLKFGKGAGDVLSDADFWTAGLTEIADNFGVRDVLSTVQEKLGNLNDLSEEAIENILSPAEKAVLQAWAINTQEQLQRKNDLSRAYQAGQGATESLGFMAEFALTGGIGKAATEGVEQMVKWLGKKALTKVGRMTDDVAAKVLKETGEKIAQSTVGKYGVGLAESLAEAAGRTGVMPSTFRNISEKATEIETDENGTNYLVKMNDAFAKGYVDSLIENLSEGGRVNALGTLFGDVAGKIPAYKKMVDKFSHTKASELWDAFNSSGVMNTLRAGGWHGLGEEYLEEWYGNALRTLTGVDKEALKDFATVDNQIVTLTSFLPMTIFGGTVSTAQVLSANKDLEKKAAALKSALMERGYDEAQANNMIDMMRGAAPAEVSETLTPIVNSVANRNTNEAAALMKPVGEFAAAVQRWQSFNTKYNYQEQEQRDGLRTQMEENLGQFWQQDENGRQIVRRGVNEKGETVYMLGKPSAEDTEAGVTPKVAAVTSDGRKVFVNPSEYQLEDELEMNVFLGNEIMAEKGNKEQARMIEEKEAKIAAIREAAVPGTAINIGTAEAPVQVVVIQRNPDGVIVNTPDGQTRQMTYEEFGNYVGVNAVPMTDAQIDEQEADALAADRAQREAALDQEYDNDDAALEELAEAEDEIEQAVDSNIPLPMKADGSVDQTALWNNDPERWAQWNDEQRQDGGANSLAYVSGAIAKEQAKIAELQAAYAAESDFDARDAVEKEIADTQARVERLTAIQQGYVAQAEAAAAPVVEAEPVAPRVASQMSEQEKAAMDAQHQARLDAARSTTAKREAMQNFINEISQGSVPMTLISMDEYEQVMKDAGCTPNQIMQVKVGIMNAKRRGQTIPAFYVPRVGIFAFIENIPNIEQLRLTYVHERQHQFTAANNIYLNALSQLGLSRERMAEIVAALSDSHFYDNFDEYTLLDEVISYAMERAYTYEDFSVALQELGIEQEIIDIITEIDNEQRNEDSTYSSRRRGRSNLHDNSGRQGYRTENDRNPETVSGGILDEQGNRPLDDGSRRTGSTGEGAEVISEEQLNAPNSGEAQQITAADGEVLADTDGKGGVRFSIRTWNEGGRDYLAAWLANDTTLTEEEKADIIARMDEFYKNALLYSDTYAPFGTWSDAGVRYDNNGNPLMSVIKANGDYAMNLDFSLVCKKRRPLNRLLRTLVNRNAFATYTLRERELAEINWILQEHGFEVACALCFVDSKRYRVTGVADVFAALYNRLVKSLAPEGVQIAHFNYNENPNVEVVENGLDTMSDDQLNWDRFDRMLSAYKPGSVEHKVAQYLREHPEARKLVDATDFIEAEGFESVKENNPDLLKFYNMKKGTGGPKASFGDVQYLNDILKKEKSFDAEKAYAVGGVRLQSFSDFVPHMYFDYMQLFAELAAKKLPLHAYTKEVLFAKIFGLTGAKINMSLVPAVVEGGVAPGLDAEGNYAWADPVTDAEGNVIQQGQSFPYDEAMAIQQAEGYSKNCGVIAVGISDAHIEKMLDDPNIPFIIPYHKSSLNAIVARMTNIDQYKDYTNVQNTRKASGSKLDKGTKDFNFNEYLHSLGESGTPQQAAQAYLDWCREHNYKPKFSQFAYHPNYYKLLQDFNTIDLATGEYAPQGAVTMTFPTEESAFGNVEILIQQGLQEDAELEEKMEQEIDGIADQVLSRLEEISKEPKMSEKQQARKMAELADERMAKIKERASGPVDIISEAEKAVDNELRMRVIGEVGARRMDDAVEATTMMDNLAVAKEMEEAGKDAKAIKMATGWERGADNLWRFEMEDFEFIGKPGRKKTFKLSDLIADLALFTAYPELKDIKVKYTKLAKGKGGEVATEKGETIIKINEDQYRAQNPVILKAVEEFAKNHPEIAELVSRGRAYAMTAEQREIYLNELKKPFIENEPYINEFGGKGTLVHEIQHVIQDIENFAQGGNSAMVDTSDPAVRNEIETLQRVLGIEIENANELVPVLKDIFTRGRMAELSGDRQTALALKAEWNKKKAEWDNHSANINAIKKDLRKFRTLGLEGYRKLAGEVESRNAEARMNMSYNERRNSLLSETEDVAREDQIFLRDNLMMKSDEYMASVSFRITPEQDKAYVDAVIDGDMETAQRMVIEAARAAGYDSPKLYHGTQSFGFTKIDTSKSDDRMSFFATESPAIARSYSSVDGERLISSAPSKEEIKKAAQEWGEAAEEALLEYSQRLYARLNQDQEIDADEFMLDLTDRVYSIEARVEEGELSLGAAVYEIYDVFDAILNKYYSKQKYDSIQKFLDEKPAVWEERIDVARAYFDYFNKLINGGAYGNYSFYANTWGMLEVECNGSNWNDIKSGDLPDRDYSTTIMGKPWKTRGVAKYAKEEGYKGVIFKNIVDPGGRAHVDKKDRLATIYDFFDPQLQVKSADPVTYDEAGKIIPLSERFNPENADIRFSIIGERGAMRDKTEEGLTRLDNLEVARQMESQLNPDWSAKENEAALKIKVATGWERGADGLWRYEVEDIKTKPAKEWLLSKKKLKLKDVVEPNPVFDVYPDLLDIDVVKDRSKYNLGASYNYASNEIKLPVGALKEDYNAEVLYYGEPQAYGNFARYWKIMEEDVIHEIQHAIQHREGFARGGTPESILPKDWEKYESLYQEVSDAIDEYNAIPWRDRQMAYAVSLRNYAENKKRQLSRFARSVMIGDEGYRRLAGEVEAHNTKNRKAMTLKERKNTLLASTEDVARKDQIFIMDAVGSAEASIRFRFTPRTDEQREQLFDKAKAHYGLTNNFNASGYMLPDGSLLDFSESNDGGDPNRRSLDHRDIEGLIMDEGKEYDSRYHYVVDFVDEGAIRMLPEAAGFQLSVAPTAEQRSRLMDYIYKHNGEVIMEITDENGSPRVYMEYNRRTSPSRIFSDMDRFFNEGVVPGIPPLRFRIANDNQAIFVSNAAKAVEGIKQEKATPEQWLKMIEKNGGLKAGEDKWMGLSDWLKASEKKTLTKQEVLDFINENMIVIEETHYLQYAEEAAADSHREIVDKLQEKFNAYVAEYHEQNPDADEYADPAGEYAIEKLREEMEDTFPYTIEKVYGNEVYVTFDYEDMEEMEKWSEKLGVVYDPQYQINSTRLDYTTSGLDEKHEIALTVPTIESWNETDEVHFGEAGEGRAVAWIRFGETVKFQERYPKAEWDAVKRFEEENGVPSLWTDDLKSEYSRLLRAFYKAQNRKKVLVIDEIQSKRHQEGREKGYRVSDIEQWLSDNNVEVVESGEFYEFIKNGETDRRFSKGLMNYDIEKAKRLYVSGYNKSDIPDAPFDKNWHELAMKRMLRYAAENGYDVIAWTKGEQQAERYNLGKIYNAIEREDNPDIEGRTFSFSGGNYDMVTVNEDGVIVDSTIEEAKGKSLSDLVGKDLAVKMMSLENYDTIDEEDLRIGGEGMKGFYDRMLPAFMNKYGKKWGVKVEDIELPNLENGLTMHSVPVTEEMKASVMEGQVMFRTIPITQEVQDEMDAIKASAIVMGNYLKAPNGADTNLTPEQWAMVRTEGFKFWFGDWEKDPENASKVIDINGEPMVVYHGTQSKFTAFDVGYKGKNFGFRLSDGFYFSPDETVAESYASFPDELKTGEVKAVFLNIINPLYIKSAKDYREQIKEIAPLVARGNRYQADLVAGMSESELLSQRGYDGVVEKRTDGITGEIVVLEPNQIKSATDNTGVFSVYDDIRFRTMYDVNTNPTEAQKKAGNHKMGHIRLDGYNITIENPKGSVRRGTDSKGNAWENTLNNDYGYIRGTEGVDGDHIDVYLSDNPTEGNVFVVDQLNPETREFDEHKVMYGFNSAEEAREAYLANFSEGWNGLGTITEVGKDEFKKWIESSHRKTKPFSEYKSVRANEMQATDESELRYRVVTDQETLNRLNSEPTIKVYRAMQLIDGKLYPPMSAKVDGELRQPIELGQWEEAEERPDLVDEKGRFKLDKGNKSSLKARYNPYFHTSPTPLNDQFSSAQTRPELVTVEVEVPESELTSGYKAEKAKNSVGKMEWKAGVVQSKLSGTRTVILSRWDKPVRIVPDSEVADVIMDMFEGKDITMPSNVVTPSLRAELEKRGVPFVETDNQGNPVEEVSFRVIGAPTDELVTNGLQLTPAQTAEVAANIFAALPEESRKKITDGLNGNILGLKDAILQIPASLASKENWNEEDKQMAEVVAEEMTKMAGEMTRPFSAEEGLWLLYNNLNKGTDLISQASRALVQRNLGFDAETLARQEQAKEGVRFRTVGDATSNAQASLYNRGAVNVWTRLKESYVDMMASVEELVKAIEKRTGKVAQGFENILLALNQQSSKGLAAMESYTQKFLNPMFDEIRRIMDETKMKYEDIVRYVILKHGLERNKKLAQRDARAHYQEIYDDIISKITGMTAAQKRTYLTNAQLKEADAKAELATLQAVDMSAMTDEDKREHKKKLAAARKAVEEAEEHLKRAQKIASLSEQEAQDELDKIFDKIENGTDSVFKEMRENDYSGISSMFYDQLGVDRKNFSTEEQYQAALMEAKKDRYSSLADVEAAAEAEVASFEGKVDTKELWKRINAATKETLRQQYEANMISKDQYLNLRDMFEYYVPLRGFKDNTAEDMYTYYRKPNSTGYTKPILGAEGRKTEAESPFGWIAAMAGSAIASNVKNEAKLALYYFVSNRPENGIATISKTWFVDSGEVDERGKKIFKPAYPPFSEDLSSAEGKAQYEIWQANMKELQKKGQAYEAGQRLNLGNAVVNISDANKPEHIVNVKVGGKDYTIIINGNPRAAQAINGDLNIEGTAQDYSALFGPLLRWMSSVNTSYNPEFWITNMMRDMAFTMMAVNIKEDPAYRRKFSKNYRKAFKVISLVAKNEKGTIGDSYLEEQYKDFVKYGGVTGYTQIKDSETWEQEIENYLSSNDPESIKSGKVMRGMKTAFHAAHRFGESLEQVSRFAAFLTARETGKSINEAINDAKEITVNFNRKGSGKMITLEEAKYLTGKNGQPLTKFQQWMVVGLSSIAPLGRRFIMFFNAAIQGLNATYKLMKKNPKRFTGWALGYAAVGMMNAVLHAMMDDDDDYLDIPQYERRNSLMIGGNGAYFKWALPQEARAFYALGDLAVETVMGRNPHQNFLGEALKIGTEILPVNPSEGWKAFMPSVAIPFIELALNEDYKGAPIYNEQKWLSEEEKERTAKWSNAYQGTGWTYVKIAQGLNFITGGDKHDAGWINLQPEKLEHLVQSAFGGTIRTADKFINTISAALDPEEPMTIRQTPFLNRFLTINDERFKNVHVNDVFDYYKADAEHALTLEKQYIKDRDMDSLTELRSSDEYQWAKIYGKYKKSLKAIQDKIKVADGTAEKKELMKQQDELKKRMIKEISEL